MSAVEVVLGAEEERLAEAQRGGFVGVGLPSLGVDFVGDDLHGDVAVALPGDAFAEELGDGFVEGGDAVLGVDDEEDEVGLIDGGGDLGLDLIGECVEVFTGVIEAGVVGGVDAEAAGIDDLGEAAGFGQVGAVEFDDDGDAVACDAGRRVNDGDLGAREHIEDGGLADIGSADDSDAGEGHGR